MIALCVVVRDIRTNDVAQVTFAERPDVIETRRSHRAQRAAALHAAEARMRSSKAVSAALAPSPIATTICLNGTVVTSPAA